MANKKISDGVGKKIVEALKKQSEVEITAKGSQEDAELTDSFDVENANEQDAFSNDDLLESLASSNEDYLESLSSQESDSLLDEEQIASFVEAPTEQPFVNYRQTAPSDSFIKELDNFEIPGNIAVLKKLITTLPSGVTKYTGAQIIKQTMEALGISMKSVLQEAQQVQDGLSNSTRECHATIQEYKKQIVLLEKQSQNYQRQYSALNDLISLFIQTGV
jgi:hypothetical protein